MKVQKQNVQQQQNINNKQKDPNVNNTNPREMGLFSGAAAIGGAMLDHRTWFSQGNYQKIAGNKYLGGPEFLRRKYTEVIQDIKTTKKDLSNLQESIPKTHSEVRTLEKDKASLNQQGKFAVDQYNTIAKPVKEFKKQQDVLKEFTVPNKKFSDSQIKNAFQIVFGHTDPKLKPQQMKERLLSGPGYALMKKLGNINNNLNKSAQPMATLEKQIKNIDSKLESINDKITSKNKTIKREEKELKEKSAALQTLEKHRVGIKAATPQIKEVSWQEKYLGIPQK